MPRKSTASSRPVVITGNWKMYKTIEEACLFVKTLAPLIENSQARVYLAVPFTALFPIAQLVEKLEVPLTIGAQNMHDAREGAFTGEIAGKMIKEAGGRFVILGHSERRHLFKETNDFINKKVKRALEEDLIPVVCIGETLEQRDKKLTESVLETQILESLKGLTVKDCLKIILAYEPVWAVGTGVVATTQEAQKAHAFCRQIIAEKWEKKVADQIIIQYGGSVKPDNAAELLSGQDIDGLLVGGASLSAETFSQIANAIR